MMCLREATISPFDYTLTLPDLPNIPNPLCAVSGVHSNAIMTEVGEVGEIYRIKPENVCDPSCSAISPHHFNLATTIEIGKKLFPMKMPEEIIVFAVGTREVARVTEEMTSKVKEAIPKVVNLVLEQVDPTNKYRDAGHALDSDIPSNCTSESSE